MAVKCSNPVKIVCRCGLLAEQHRQNTLPPITDTASGSAVSAAIQSTSAYGSIRFTGYGTHTHGNTVGESLVS
jgi:hypothetical protein